MLLTRLGLTRDRSRRLLRLLPLAVLVALVVACDAPQSTSEIAGSNNDKLWGPYTLILWLAGIVFVAVLALTLIFSIWFRERPGREAQQIHGHTRLEIIWTLIPVVIVAVIAVPTFNTIFDMEDDVDAEGAMQVTATGHQWWFEFEYPDLGITTANEVHLAEGQPVTFTLLSNDVIHSFWVPQLAGKVDMVPGHENELATTPLEARPEPYLGQCAEFCGISHANMRFRVFVHTPEDFEAWVQKMQSDAEEPEGDLETQGQQLFLQSACIGCHTVKGTAAAGVIGPDLTHIGSRTTIGAGIIENTPENMARWIHNPADVKPGSLMPPQGASAGGTLTNEQIDAIVAYLQGLE